MKGLATNLNIHAEIRTDIERRVDIDQFQPTSVLNLPTQWTSL